MLLGVAALLVTATTCQAQFGGGGGLGGGGGGGGGGLGGGGGGGGLGGGGGGGGGNQIGAGGTSGVLVDAQGVLRCISYTAGDLELLRMRADQAAANLDRQVARPSALRKVSLTRLIRRINQHIAEGHGPDEIMQNLAGLTRVRYVFYYPETQDIVLAGPAEGWFETPTGRMVGLQSGQPVLELQDLIVALRTFAADAEQEPLVYCSIDPTPEGLARTQQFLSQIGRQIGPNDTQMIVTGLRESMGLQKVTIGGISPHTHFAQVLVEADYRMKLIGIGLEEPPVRIASFVALANPATLASNALVRWWFVPDYERIRVSEDHTAAEFVGHGVKLVGEDELVAADGSRSRGGGQSGASRRFTRGFTQNYHHLAEASPVYAQLRNCIDLLVAAAFLRQHDLFATAGLELGPLAEESQYPVENYHAPEEVATAVNAIWKRRQLMTPFGGGVEIRPSQALSADHLQADDGSAAKAREAIDLSKLAADQWWWD
jgi:hypothetical protein